ncbi:MAG: hypothetical protein K6E91_09820 [Butyrivibrio sp.]|nr:hypothetical protein [Butyrivibrio sp.]
MPEEYFFYNNETGETQKVSKDKYQTIHTERYQNAQSPEEKKQATLDYLNGIRSNTRAILPNHLEMLNKAGDSYKDRLNHEQRIFNSNYPLSELGKKKQNAMDIFDAESEFQKTQDKYVSRLQKKSTLGKDRLKGISAFLTGNRQSDEELAFAWISRKSDPEGLKKIISGCITEFLKLPLDALDISTDRNLAENAIVLEKINAQYKAITDIISDNRDVYDSLPEDVRNSFENKIGQVNGLVNYYRLMREVITNPYYITHENGELSKREHEHDSPAQKQLFSLLSQSEAGLLAFRNIGAKELDNKLNNMMGAMRSSVVKDEQLKLQKELADREQQIDKMGFSEYLNYLENKGSLDGMKKSVDKSLFNRAINSIVALTLPDNVENGADSLISILNQLEFVSNLSQEKIDHQNYYNLEHDYRQIAIMEKVVTLSGPLKTMKRTILEIVNVSDKGKLIAKKNTPEETRSLQQKYQEALTEYKKIMKSVTELRNGAYLNLASDDTFTEQKDKNSLPTLSKAEAENQLKDLYLALAQNEFSDISIYRNAKKIIDLNAKCKDIITDGEHDQLKALAELALEISINKRRKDLDCALSQDNIPAEDLKRLTAEKEELEKISSPNKTAAREEALEKCRKIQYNLRLEAQKEKFDSEDLKAIAVNHLYQDQWAQNAKKAEETGSFFDRFKIRTYSRITRFLSWAASITRSKVHGSQLYDQSKAELAQLPAELRNFGEEGANPVITHGDGNYAPKIELNKYFKDPMKMQLLGDYQSIKSLMNDETVYPQCITDAVDALSSYSQVRGVVNNNTFEMEQAFLCKFRDSVNALLKDSKAISDFPALTEKIKDANQHLEEQCNGNLRSQMTQEEYEAAKESTAIYTTMTYFGDTEESNVKDIPLFPHAPQLNDIKQGVLGNCYMVGSIQSLLIKNPKAIQDMFHDLGDGNVLVRFYAAFGIVDGAYRRIDDPTQMSEATIRPVYIKVRKHYTAGEEGSGYCMWMQLLEKAYAAAGFNNGKPDIDENGELHNLNAELINGDPADVLFHLTGNKHSMLEGEDYLEVDAKPQSVIINDAFSKSFQKKLLFSGIPAYLHDSLYNELFKNDKDISLKWNEDYLKTAVNKVIGNESKIISNIIDIFKQLEAEGIINSKEHSILYNDLYTQYQSILSENWYKDYPKTILKNLNNPGYNFQRRIDDPLSPIELLNDISTAIKNDKSSNKENAKEDNHSNKENAIEDVKLSSGNLFHTICNMLYGDKTYYERIQADKEPECNQLIFSTQNLLLQNPQERYAQKELGYLRKIKEILSKDQAVPLASNSGHVMTALDVQLYNDKWFVLIRDPFNTYRYEYTQNEDGQIKKKSYGLGSAMYNHRSLKKLSPELKHGFMGTSWWELKDVYSQFTGNIVEETK